MIKFNIPAMSCGHCVGVVTQAVKSVDSAAQVQVDLATKQVQVDSSADRQLLEGALTAAGYPPA